jgi:uncharacterized protein (TIGR00725 family)
LISVGVFGSSLPSEPDSEYEDARELGRRLAGGGGRVVCGGYGGVMEAACRGAAEAGGTSVGVVIAGRGTPNPWVTESIAAIDRADRLRLLREMTESWVFLPRGLGTMLELVWIAESVVKGDVRARPLVLLGDSWRSVLERAISEGSDGAGARALAVSLRVVRSPEEAAAAALARPQAFR